MQIKKYMIVVVIIYYDARFEVMELKIDFADGVESAYDLLVPRKKDKPVMVKQILSTCVLYQFLLVPQIDQHLYCQRCLPESNLL